MKRMLAIVAALALFAPAASAEVEFLHAKNDKPLVFKYRKKQEITEAVTQFRTNGANPYTGDDAAITAGGKLYKKLCVACHAADGSGKVGPSLIDDEWQYARTGTDVGRFEIIYGGGKKSMRAFGRQVDQDGILKVMAYLDVLGSQDPALTAKSDEPAAAKVVEGRSTPPVPFTEVYLTDDANIAVGGKIWADQCRHCHGAKAYPGKAPKLKPRKYKPDFVYRRVTDGFRKMPPWKDAFSDEERMQIVTYIMSRSFSP